MDPDVEICRTHLETGLGGIRKYVWALINIRFILEAAQN